MRTSTGLGGYTLSAFAHGFIVWPRGGFYQYQSDVIESLDLDEYIEIADTVTERTQAEGIAQFLEIEENLKKVAHAARECATDPDEYIEL